MTWINNYKEAIKDFDFDKYFAIKVDVKEDVVGERVIVSGSTLAVNISKRSKQADEKYSKRRKVTYATNYEKGLITIQEKHNGEI